MTEESTDHSIDTASAMELEQALLEGVQDDARLGSGVQDESSDSDLTFINMTGLVEPVKDEIDTVDSDATTMQYSDSDMDPEAPVSFYEEGVDDVDADMDPDNASVLDTEDVLDSASASEDSVASASLSELQSIITELKQPDADTSDAVADEAIESEEEASLEVENLTAQNLEAASAALDDLNVPINTELAELLADAADRLDEQDTTEPVSEAEVPVSEINAGVNLDEAESLMNELEAQDRDDPISTVAALIEDIDKALDTESTDQQQHEKVHITSINFNALGQSLSEEVDSSVYSKPPLPKTPSRYKHRRKRNISLAQMFTILLILIGLTTVGVYSLNLYRNQTLSPDELLQTGTDMLENGEYRMASEHFSTKVPEPKKSQASFLAAYALQLIPVKEQGYELSDYHESVDKFETFILDYPENEKVARAETLLGILYYKIGRTPEAIRMLSDPRRRLRDPGGYLPSLRVLAHLYAEDGDMEKAHQIIMQVLNLTDNITPDKDLIELANMFVLASEGTSNKQERIDDMSQAVTIWNQVILLPTMLKVTREKLETKRNYFKELIATLEATEGETVPVLNSTISNTRETQDTRLTTAEEHTQPEEGSTTSLPSAVVVTEDGLLEESSAQELPPVANQSEQTTVVSIEASTETEVVPNPNSDALDLNSLRIPEDL